MASNSTIAPSDALATTAVRVAAFDASQPQSPLQNASSGANVIHAAEDPGEDAAMREAIATGGSGDINGGNDAEGVRDVEDNGNDEDDEDDGDGDDDDDVDEDDDDEEGTGLESEKKHEPQHATDVSSVDNVSSKDGPNIGTVDAVSFANPRTSTSRRCECLRKTHHFNACDDITNTEYEADT